jgi:integrase
VRRFSAWLTAEGEIPADELAGMRPPKLDDKMPEELTADQMKALLATCGPSEFHDIRDEAIIRPMTEAMVRSGELPAMRTDEVDIRAGSALVRQGKGGKGPACAVRPADRPGARPLARARRRHPLEASPRFWLANRARVMSYEALYSTLRRRLDLGDL